MFYFKHHSVSYTLTQPKYIMYYSQVLTLRTGLSGSLVYPEFQIHLSREQGVSIKFRIPVLHVVCATTIIVSEVSLKIRTTFNTITAVIHCRRIIFLGCGFRFSIEQNLHSNRTCMEPSIIIFLTYLRPPPGDTQMYIFT